MADGIIVFAGPSLPSVVASPAGMQMRPPARRGDVYRALRDRPRTVVLIDGEFHGSPAVWHRELLDAIAEGTSVIGASSMGALRAAELHGLGMIGCGRIFEAFRDGEINDDDEVALVYGPPHLGYPALSEPMVNLRATLSLAKSAGLIDDGKESEALAHAKALHFSQRSHAVVIASPPFARDAELRARYAKFVATSAVDQKRADALAALQLAADPRNEAGRRVFARECLSEGIWAPARAAMEFALESPTLPAPSALLARCGLPPSDEKGWWAELSWRWFARHWLRDKDAVAFARPWELTKEPPPFSGLTAAGFARLTREVEESELAVALALPAIAADGPAVRIQRRLASSGRTAMAGTESAITACARKRIAADWAASRGITPAKHEFEAAMRRLEAALGGNRAAILTSLEIGEPAYLATLAELIRADWVVERGPTFFGYSSWSFPVALLRELQRQGIAAPLPATAAA